MPRKKPDLTPWKSGDNRVDSVFARMVYFNQWGENYIMRMKDEPTNQRTVKCQGCGIVMPRDVPRLSREGSWYRKGHLCVECGIKEIDQFIQNMEVLNKEIQEHIALGRGLRECATEIAGDPRYPEKLAMGKMLQVMRGERKSKGY